MPRIATSAKQRTQRVEHLDARVSHEQRKLIERAAALSGLSVADFVASNLQKAAQRAIAESEVVRLNEHESRVFAEALMHPRTPNANLRKAAARYLKHSL